MKDKTMSVHSLARGWWLIVLRGLCAVAFGLATWIWPNITFVALIFFLGAYLLTDGVFAVGAGLSRHNGSQPWWLLLIEGAIGIVAGISTFVFPNLTALILLYLISAWAIITGAVAIVSAIRLRKEIENEKLLALSGIFSLLLGVVLLIWPGATAMAAIWLIGTYAVISGFLLIGLGFRLWNWQSSILLETLHPVWVGGGRHPHRPAEK